MSMEFCNTHSEERDTDVIVHCPECVFDAEEAVEKWEFKMYCAEMSDNFYYTSGRRKRDQEHLATLKAKVEELS